MTNVAPKGYSLNTYPDLYNDETHVVIVSSLPVFTDFSTSETPLSPSSDSDKFKMFISSGDRIVILDNSVGFNGNWKEIYIPGDENGTAASATAAAMLVCNEFAGIVPGLYSAGGPTPT